MARPANSPRKVTQKRARRKASGRTAAPLADFDEKRMKQLIKEAVREVLKERDDLAEQEEAAWDRQMEVDVEAGRLDRLADEAIAELHRGQATEL